MASNIKFKQLINIQQPLSIITTALLLVGKTYLAISLGQCFSNMSMHQNYLEGLVNYNLLSPTPGVFDSRGMEWGTGVCISNKSPGDAVAASLETTVMLENHYLKITWNTSNTLSPQRAWHSKPKILRRMASSQAWARGWPSQVWSKQPWYTRRTQLSWTWSMTWN